MKLSIIIVNYNTKDLLRQTLNSVIKTTRVVDYKIIVVDNSSSDGSCEMILNEFPDVILIKNEANYGFSKANNIAIRQTNSDYVLLLNSDTVVYDGCIDRCMSYIVEDREIGALGCKILLPDGSLDHACKRGFPSPLASFYYMLKLDKLFPASPRFGQYTLNYLSQDNINDVDSLTGAFMILSRKVIDEVGMLDEDFFMYGEDIDWCYRIKEAGYKITYYPRAEILHLKGGSSRKRRTKTIYEFHRAMLLFYNKHYKKKYNIIITLLVYASIYMKMSFSVIVNYFKR